MGINFFSSDSDEDFVVEPVKPSAKISYTIEQIIDWLNWLYMTHPDCDISEHTIRSPFSGIEIYYKKYRS